MDTILRWTAYAAIAAFIVWLAVQIGILPPPNDGSRSVEKPSSAASVDRPAPNISQQESLSDIQKKELTLFGMKAMGLKVGIKDVKNVPSDAETKKMVATGLNLNVHLCAELTSIKPLKIKSTYEASCVAYRGGNAQKSYVIDAKKGVAFVP